MRAAVFEQFGGPLTICDVADPAPVPDSVVVRVEANGVCRSDWHGWMGHDPDVKLPHVPGHELAGVVADVGNQVAKWHVGDRVTVPFACGCGQCRYCRQGQLQVCDAYFQPGFTHWGAFAEYVEIKHADANLVRLPSELEFTVAAGLGCRFATAYRAIVQQGRTRPGDWVAIHGCGGVGLSAVMIADAVGAHTLAIDVRADKLSLAQSLGATHVIDASQQEDLIEVVHDITKGGADVSLDALGSQQTCQNSLLSLRKQGRHVQVGLLPASIGDPSLPMSAVIGRELEILGSHGLSARDYPALLEMVTNGQLDPGRLVQKRIPLADAPDELIRMGDFQTVGVTVIDRFDV